MCFFGRFEDTKVSFRNELIFKQGIIKLYPYFSPFQELDKKDKIYWKSDFYLQQKMGPLENNKQTSILWINFVCDTKKLLNRFNPIECWLRQSGGGGEILHHDTTTDNRKKANCQNLLF